MKNTKNFMIITLLIVMLLMAVGYSTFATQLKLKGTSEVIGEWDVRIINIEAQKVSEGCNPGNPEYTMTTAKFNAKLVKPGDSITYVITIKNEGTIDATLTDVVFFERETPSEINYTTTEFDHSLKAGEQTQLSVIVEYIFESNKLPETRTKDIIGVIQYMQM